MVSTTENKKHKNYETGDSGTTGTPLTGKVLIGERSVSFVKLELVDLVGKMYVWLLRSRV